MTRKCYVLKIGKPMALVNRYKNSKEGEQRRDKKLTGANLDMGQRPGAHRWVVVLYIVTYV